MESRVCGKSHFNNIGLVKSATSTTRSLSIMVLGEMILQFCIPSVHSFHLMLVFLLASTLANVSVMSSH